MRIGNPFNEALRNPFVDTMLGANAFAQLVPLFKGADHSQEFINAAEASGQPVTSIPRRGLLSFISPNIQATPDQLNQEKIALQNQGAGRLASDIQMRAALGPQNYAALRSSPQYASMFANAPDLAAALPGEAKKDGPPVYAINQRDGSEIVLKPGEAPPAGYVTSSFYKKPGSISEAQLAIDNPQALDTLERAKHKYDRTPAGSFVPINGADGKLLGFYNPTTKAWQGPPVEGGYHGAPPKAPTGHEADVQDWLKRNPGKTREDANKALIADAAAARASGASGPKPVDPTMEKQRRERIVSNIGSDYDKTHPTLFKTDAYRKARNDYIKLHLGGVDPVTYVNRGNFTPPSSTPISDSILPPTKVNG